MVSAAAPVGGAPGAARLTHSLTRPTPGRAPRTHTHRETLAGQGRGLQRDNRVTRAEQMNREGAHGKTPDEMYIQQKVRVLLMLRKMGSNLTSSEEAFLRTYAGVVNSQLSQLPQHPIDQGAEDVVMAFSRQETEDRRQ